MATISGWPHYPVATLSGVLDKTLPEYFWTEIFLCKPDLKGGHQRLSQLPGPGSYKVSSSTFKLSRFSLRPRRDNKIRSNSPGPCAYIPNDTPVSKKPVGGYIPKAVRSKSFKDKKEVNPGPGSYKIPSCFGDQLLKYPIIKYKKK